MAFNKYSLGIIIRVFIIVLLSGTLAYVWLIKNWFFAPLFTLSLLLIAVYELVYLLHRQQRELNNFLISIKQGGFTASYKEDGPSRELFATFNQIIVSFQDLALEKEENYLFLQVITENLKAAIIAYNGNGSITMLNQAAKSLINRSYLSQIDELAKYQPKLFDSLQALPPGQAVVVKLPQENKVNDILVQKKLIKIGDEELSIILLQNIRDQIDSNELESWQKIIRVMRHEIMNSLTPIVGLSQAIHTLLEDKDQNTISGENYKDMQESMEAISFRSKALLQFVNAYKSFSEIVSVQNSSFDAVLMAQRVSQLLKKSFGSKKILITITPGPIEMIGDEQQLEGVVLNLIKNSIEAIEKEGVINVILSNKGASKISITDNGSGITDEQREQIFTPFYTTKEEGSGIGLSLSRKVILKHGGTIDAYNNQEGGLTVELSF